jgi:hypothetical protein
MASKKRQHHNNKKKNQRKRSQNRKRRKSGDCRLRELMKMERVQSNVSVITLFNICHRK